MLCEHMDLKITDIGFELVNFKKVIVNMKG